MEYSVFKAESRKSPSFWGEVGTSVAVQTRAATSLNQIHHYAQTAAEDLLYLGANLHDETF
jgi:hypothetical protein